MMVPRVRGANKFQGVDVANSLCTGPTASFLETSIPEFWKGSSISASRLRIQQVTEREPTRLLLTLLDQCRWQGWPRLFLQWRFYHAGRRGSTAYFPHYFPPRFLVFGKRTPVFL